MNTCLGQTTSIRMMSLRRILTVSIQDLANADWMIFPGVFQTGIFSPLQQTRLLLIKNNVHCVAERGQMKGRHKAKQPVRDRSTINHLLSICAINTQPSRFQFSEPKTSWRVHQSRFAKCASEMCVKLSGFSL